MGGEMPTINNLRTHSKVTIIEPERGTQQATILGNGPVFFSMFNCEILCPTFPLQCMYQSSIQNKLKTI